MNVPHALVLLVFILSTTALADGRLFGTVRDGATMEPVREARVTIEGPALPDPREIRVDETGGYTLTIPAGTYDVTYSASGFLPFRYRIVVRPNASIRANLDLCPDAVSCCLLVMSRPPSVDVGSAVQQPELSAFLPDRRPWGGDAPSRRLIAPRME